MMEVYPEIVEPLSYEMSINEERYVDIDTSRTVEDVCNLIEKQYTWLLDINFDQKDNVFNFWYYSKNKQEPRMSDRFSEEGADLELPLAIARDIHQLYLELKTMEFGSDLGTYLLKNQLINKFYLFRSPKSLSKAKDYKSFSSLKLLNRKDIFKSKISSKLAKDTITIYKR